MWAISLPTGHPRTPAERAAAAGVSVVFFSSARVFPLPFRVIRGARGTTAALFAVAAGGARRGVRVRGVLGRGVGLRGGVEPGPRVSSRYISRCKLRIGQVYHHHYILSIPHRHPAPRGAMPGARRACAAHGRRRSRNTARHFPPALSLACAVPRARSPPRPLPPAGLACPATTAGDDAAARRVPRAAASDGAVYGVRSHAGGCTYRVEVGSKRRRRMRMGGV